MATDNFHIKPKHERILAQLGMLTLATAQHINRALYASGTITTTVQYLAELYKHRYVDKVYWRRFERGNPREVFKLAGRGMRHLKRVGMAPPDLIRPSDNLSHTRSQMAHTMGCTDLIVHALELSKHDASFEVGILSEPTLRRKPIVLSAGTQSEITIYPDAFIHLIKHRDGQEDGMVTLCFELTRTTDRERIKRKFDAWIRADGSAEYEATYGSPFLVVVWIVDGGNVFKRDLLAKTCWDYLQEVHATEKADLFRFGMVSDDTNGEEFFFNPGVFVQPGSPLKRMSLLPQSWRSA